MCSVVYSQRVVAVVDLVAIEGDAAFACVDDAKVVEVVGAMAMAAEGFAVGLEGEWVLLGEVLEAVAARQLEAGDVAGLVAHLEYGWLTNNEARYANKQGGEVAYLGARDGLAAKCVREDYLLGREGDGAPLVGRVACTIELRDGRHGGVAESRAYVTIFITYDGVGGARSHRKHECQGEADVSPRVLSLHRLSS